MINALCHAQPNYTNEIELGKSGPPLRAAGPRPFQYNFRSACPFEQYYSEAVVVRRRSRSYDVNGCNVLLT